MIDLLIKNIKTNMAQRTSMFDVETINPIVATTKNNIITIPTLDGEYTLSGANDSVCSKGCINDTLKFNSGNCVTDSYFGDTQTTHNLIAHRVNVGSAFKREVGLEIITDTKIGNSIIVYIGSATNVSDRNRDTISEDLNLKVSYTVGVLFKIQSKQADELGVINYDSLFINSAVGATKNGATIVEFKNVVDRFYAGKSYIVDMQFGYVDNMFMDEYFIDSIKNFDSSIGGLTI